MSLRVFCLERCTCWAIFCRSLMDFYGVCTPAGCSSWMPYMLEPVCGLRCGFFS